MTRFHRLIGMLLVGVVLVCLPVLAAHTGRSTQASPAFNAPEPDHLTLFKMYMAAHGEALANSPNAMWEHYLLFSIPVGPPPRDRNDRGSPSKECFEFGKRLENEITRQSIIEDARAQFRKALGATGGWPKVMTFRLKLEEAVDQYDMASGSFSLRTTPSILIAARPTGVTFGHAYNGPVQSWCQGNARMITPDMLMSFHSGLWLTGFKLNLIGTDALTRLPMSPNAAETFIEEFSSNPTRTGGRRVGLELLVEAGPVPFVLHQGVPAKIVAARALHPLTGATLHTFDVRGSDGTAPRKSPTPVAASITGSPATASALFVAADVTPVPRPIAASEQSSAVSFSAPEIDHLALFKLYLAAHADVLGSNVAAAWEHYLLFNVPKGPPSTGPYDTGTPSKECSDLSRRLFNEVTRQSIIQEAQAQFRTALVSAAAEPKTGVFLLRTQERLGTYDVASGTFAVEPGFDGASVIAPDQGMGLKIGRESACRPSYQSTRQNWCSATLGPAEQFSGCARVFSLEILGKSALQRMPMERGAAEAFLNADARGIRAITLETVVEVGPAPLRAPDVAGYMAGKERIPARIVAARALDPKSGAVLHTFAIGGAKTASSPASSTGRPAAAPAAAPPPTTAPAAAQPGNAASASSTMGRKTSVTSATPVSPPPARVASGDTLPFTSYRGLLLTIRDHPNVLTDQAQIDLAQVQVRAEQNAWDVVSNRVAAGGSGLTLMNPKRPAFTYEWQTLVDTDPALAGGPLLDTFLRTDADWSFVTNDPAWDDRFGPTTPVEVFLFARDKIQGRDHRFAAQELGPVYGRLVKMASAKAPTSLSLRLRMPPGVYDFQVKALRFLPQNASVVSGHRPVQELDLLPGAERYQEIYRLPPETNGRASYMLMGLSSDLRRAEPPSTKPGIAMPNGPTDVWRGAVSIGASGNVVPVVELLALDRRAQISTVPIDAARAEELTRRQPGLPAIDGFTATLVFDAERVVLSQRFVARQPTPNAVLLARVKRIDVFDPDGKLLTSISADALPAPAATSSPAAAPAPPAPRPASDTRWETAREKQRLENEKINEVGARINRRTVIHSNLQRDILARMQACQQQAAKAAGGQTSPAYERAAKVCDEKASRVATCVQQLDQARVDPLTPEYQKGIDACVQAAWK